MRFVAVIFVFLNTFPSLFSLYDSFHEKKKFSLLFSPIILQLKWNIDIFDVLETSVSSISLYTDTCMVFLLNRFFPISIGGLHGHLSLSRVRAAWPQHRLPLKGEHIFLITWKGGERESAHWEPLFFLAVCHIHLTSYRLIYSVS